MRNLFIRWMAALGCAMLLVVGPVAAQDGDDLVPFIVNLLHDSDKDIRAIAFEQIRAEAPGTEATKQFAAELSKVAPEVQIGLLAALAARADNAARDDVLKALTDAQDDAVKIASIDALGALGQAADVPTLAKFLGADNKKLQTTARSSLVRVPGEDVPAAITAEAKNSSPEVRATLIGVLAERRGLSEIPALLQYATGEEKSSRMAAMAALGEIAGAEQVPALLNGVLKAEPGPERDAAEKAVMFVCQRIQPAAARANGILSTLRGKSDVEQWPLLPTLGRVGGNVAREVVEHAIDKQDEAAHAAGIRALCNWPDASVAPRLIELLKDDAHPEHRALAMKALIRVAPLADGRSDAERLEMTQQAFALCTRDEDRKVVLQRTRAIRSPDALRFVAPFMDDATFKEIACETVVELAHHRTLREAAKPEFMAALDKVIAVTKDPVLVERSQRYKNNQTWARPKPQQ